MNESLDMVWDRAGRRWEKTTTPDGESLWQCHTMHQEQDWTGLTELFGPMTEEPPVTQHEIEAVAAVIWHETANDNDPLDYNAIARAALEAARRA